jgi:hypothetical protein
VTVLRMHLFWFHPSIERRWHVGSACVEHANFVEKCLKATTFFERVLQFTGKKTPVQIRKLSVKTNEIDAIETSA